MKIILFSTMMFVFISNTNAQNLHLNLFAGTSNYSGDLQDKRYTFSQSHFAGGLGVSYDITDHFSVQSSMIFGTISANDKYGRNKVRNLNFGSALSELSVGGQYFITPISEHVLTPYIFAGYGDISF